MFEKYLIAYNISCDQTTFWVDLLITCLSADGTDKLVHLATYGATLEFFHDDTTISA